MILKIDILNPSQLTIIPGITSTQFSQRLHLSQNSPLITARITHNNGILKGNVTGNFGGSQRLAERTLPGCLIVVRQFSRVVIQLPIGRELTNVAVGLKRSVGVARSL